MESRLQFWRVVSIGGALLVGFWSPVRLIGYESSLVLEATFAALISAVAGISLWLDIPKEDRRKLSSWLSPGVILDLLCLFPTAFLWYVATGHTPTALLLLNLTGARHIRQIKPFLDEFDSLKATTYRLVPIFLALPLLVHIMACAWIALGSGTAGIDDDPMLTYIKAIYWTFTTLTTVGYGDITARTGAQMLFTCGVELIGVGVFGFILSNVASLLSRSDANREHHMNNLDKIDTFMHTHRIPSELRAKTRGYYHYLWTHKKGYQDRSLLEDLPVKLQSELLFFINRSIIEKVPFLKNANPEMIEALMDRLEPRIFVPGERVFRAGDPGDALYFIQSGDVEILSADGIPLARLTDGAFFGEMALLTDRPRSASAVAVSYCDAYLLHCESFNAVVNAHPDFKHHIEKVMSDRKTA
jgi:hypothetical protein